MVQVHLAINKTLHCYVVKLAHCNCATYIVPTVDEGEIHNPDTVMHNCNIMCILYYAANVCCVTCVVRVKKYFPIKL